MAFLAEEVTSTHWQSLAVSSIGAWTWQHVALSDSHQALWLQPHNFVSAEGSLGEGSLLFCSFRSDNLTTLVHGRKMG